MDDDAVARLRAAVGRLERRLNSASLDVGLTPTQMSVLNAIARQGPVGVGDLATAENLNPTMLSRVVGKLESAGLISRTPDPDDRRVTLVASTPAGRRLKARIQQRRTAALAELLTLLSPEQDAALAVALPALEALSADARRS